MMGQFFFLWRASLAKVDLRGWALRPPEVNKSIIFGTSKGHRIDLALKMWSLDVISLTRVKTVAEL